MVLVVWCAIIAGAGAWSNLDPALLRPAVNLVSNCSFEAVGAEGQPLGWTVAEGPATVAVAAHGAVHGRNCLLVSTPEGQGVEAQGPAAWQSVRVEERVDYVLHAWLRGTSPSVGAPAMAVELRDEAGQSLGRQEASWEGVPGQWAAVTLRFTAPPGAHRAIVQLLCPPAGAEIALDAVSLTRADGLEPSRTPAAIGNFRAAFLQPTWALLAWEGAADSYVVEWRSATKRASWRRTEGIPENFYAIVNLAPDSSYQARVSPTVAPFYDEHGMPLVLGSRLRPSLLSFRTPAIEPRRWAGFKVWPAVHLDTFPDGVTAAALEAVEDRLYVLEARKGALYLSRVAPETRRVEWTKLVVEPAPEVDVVAPDMCVMGERLWIAWDSVPCSAATPLEGTRRCLTSWDLTTGLRGEILVVEPTLAGAGTSGGSVAPFRGALWLAWAEEPAGQQASRLVLAPFDPQAGLGARIIWDDCPASHPKAPCLIPTDGDLGLAYTDMPGLGSEGSYEPLLWASFVRQRFTGLRALLSFGRTSHPRGLRFGSFVLLACESKTRFDRLGTCFTDIWLLRLGPGAGDMTTMPYADDYKHNARPDLALCRGDVYVAYTKFEREPGASAQAPRSYGTYLGRLEPEVKPGP
jgi:hypothetical protein